MNKTSEQLGELFGALAKAQGKIRGAICDSENTFYKKGNKPSQYASLEACFEAAKQALSENNLSVVQSLQEIDGKPYISTILGHDSGQYISSTFPLISKDQSAHAVAGAVTYWRRYAFCSMIGLAQIDDDGQQAMGYSSPIDDDGQQAMGYSSPNAQGSNNEVYHETMPRETKKIDSKQNKIDSDRSIQSFVEEMEEKTSSSMNVQHVEQFLYELSVKKGGKPMQISTIMYQALKDPMRFLNSYNQYLSKAS